MTLLQQLIILIVLYICAYSLVDRICEIGRSKNSCQRSE